MAAAFRERWGDGYSYRETGGWDMRNPGRGDSNHFHAVATDRVFRAGDLFFRLTAARAIEAMARTTTASGTSVRLPDVVREWYSGDLGVQPRDGRGRQAREPLLRHLRGLRAGRAPHGFPLREVGRIGHGLRTPVGCRCIPDNHTVLEPGMVDISRRAMFAAEHGFYDLEDQYLVTETGREALHELAPETLPVIEA